MRRHVAIVAGLVPLHLLAAAHEVADSHYTIYDDATAWHNDPVRQFVELQHTGTVYRGSHAIALTFSRARPKLVLTAPAPISLSGYDRLEFRVHGGAWGTGCRRLGVYLNGNTWTYGRIQRIASVPCGQWTLLSIPLSYFGNPAFVARLEIGQEMGYVPQPTCYVDDIRLVRGSASDAYDPQPAFPEMLRDGGFEQGGIGQYMAGCDGLVISNNPHGGAYAMRVFARVPDKAWAGPNFDVTRYFDRSGPGIYELSGWFRMSHGTGNVNLVTEVISCDPYTDSGAAAAVLTQPRGAVPVGPQWTRVTKRIRVAPGTRLNVFKMNAVAAATVAEFMVDDLSMRKINDGADASNTASLLHMPVTGEILTNIATSFTTRVLGRRGAAPGAFCFPHGIAVNAQGALYVADTDNHRIQQRDARGGWTTFGTRGTNAGEFCFPRGIAVAPDGTVYVADSGNLRIQAMDRTGAWHVVHTTLAWGDRNGWVLDTQGPMTLDGMCVDTATNLCVVDPWKGLVWTLDARRGTWRVLSHHESIRRTPRTQSGLGTSAGMCDLPRGICADTHGALLLADTGNHRVQRRDATGTWTVLAGTAPDVLKSCVDATRGAGLLPGQFDSPRAVAVDARGNVYVADSGNHRVQRRDAARNTWQAWGTHGAGIGQFDCPGGIAVDAAGTIYVADTRNHRIVMFTRK